MAARGARSLTPAQWGDEDIIDEDVAAEVLRVSSGAADADVVKASEICKKKENKRKPNTDSAVSVACVLLTC